MSKFLPAAGIAGAVIATKQLVSLASAADESANAVNVTFKEAASIIDDFGDTAADAIGLSKTEFNELSTVIGAQLKQSGLDIQEVADQTVNLTGRAADLASVFNTSVTEATTALGAALRGESEPARRFGINISDAAVQAEALASGLVKSKSEITDQIKVQARLNLIFKQSQDVAGDFQNTSDGLANQTRILQSNLKDLGAEIGQAFVPATTEAVSGVNKLVSAFKEAVIESRSFEEALAAATGRGGIEATVDGVNTLRRGIEELRKREQQLLVTIRENADANDARQRQIAAGARQGLEAVRGQIRASEIRLTQLGNQLAAEGKLAAQTQINNELAEKAAVNAEAQAEAEKERQAALAETQAAEQLILENQILEAGNALRDRRGQIIDENREKLREEIALTQQLAERNEALANTIRNQVATSYANAFGAIGEALVNGESATKAFAKAALNGFASILDALAAELAARAILGLFINPALTGPALAGAAAASVAAGAIRASAANFQQGTPEGQPFIVPGTSGADTQSIAVEPGEEVTVNSRARTARDGGGRPTNLVINFDGREIGKILFDLSKDRVLTIDRGAVVTT